MFNAFKNLFKRDTDKKQAPTSNIGAMSRQQKNTLTNPNRNMTVAPKATPAMSWQQPQAPKPVVQPQRQTAQSPIRLAGGSMAQGQKPASYNGVTMQPINRKAPTPFNPSQMRVAGQQQPVSVPQLRTPQSTAIQYPVAQSQVSRTQPAQPVRDMRQQAFDTARQEALAMKGAGVTGQINFSAQNQNGQSNYNVTPQDKAQFDMPQMPQQQEADPFMTMQDFYNRSEQNRLKAIQEQMGLDQDVIGQTFDAQNQVLQGQIPQLQEGYDQFRRDVLAGIDDETANTQRSIAKEEEASGADQRQLAETRRQMMAQQERRFANQGAIDSYGAGSFREATANDEANFMRMTNENMQRKADRVNQLEVGLRQFTRQAQTQINSENMKLKQAIAQIQGNMAMNDIQKNAAIRQAVLTANQAKTAIKDEFEGMRLQLQQEKLAFQTEQQSMNGLSEQFLTTGRPQTPADIEFFQKNKDGMGAYMDGMGMGAADSSRSEVTNLIDEIMGRDVGAIAGMGRLNPLNAVPGAPAQYTARLADQLQNKLSLDAREKLKGTGAISDFEARMLANSMSALGNNISKDDYMKELAKIRSILNKGNQGGQMQGNQNDPLGLGF